MTDLNYLFALLAGLLSFMSPCTLPLYPAFLSYITGVSANQLTREGIRQKQALLHTIFFLIGFSLIFIALGFSTSFIRMWLTQYDELIRHLGGIAIVFFGLVIAGVCQPSFLMKTRKIELARRPIGYIGSGMIGFVFAAGWTPCTGPILASILLLGSTQPSAAVGYMTVYVIGFAVPFIVMAFLLPKLSFLTRHLTRFMQIGGVIMVIIGVLIFFDQMSKLNTLLTPLFGDFTGF